MAIKIVVDSASDISKEEGLNLGIKIIPLEVSFGDVIYKDGDDLSIKRFYELLIEGDTIPKTSQINSYRFDEVFSEFDKEDDVLVITLSSKLSGTYHSAVLASKNYKNVKVVDSLSASAGERILVYRALELIKMGKRIDEIEMILNKEKNNIILFALLDTLKYLKKGGRISAVKAFSAELLSIKPVIAVINGEVKLVGKARGSKNGNNLLNKEIEKANGVNFDLPCGVIYSGFHQTLADKYIMDNENLWINKIEKLPVYPIGCTIGTHIGPNAIGVAFFKNND